MGYQARAPRGAVNGRPSPTPATSTRNFDLQAPHQQQIQPTADTMAATPRKMGLKSSPGRMQPSSPFGAHRGLSITRTTAGIMQNPTARRHSSAPAPMYTARRKMHFVILCGGWLPGCGSAPESAVLGWTCCPHPTRANSADHRGADHWGVCFWRFDSGQQFTCSFIVIKAGFLGFGLQIVLRSWCRNLPGLQTVEGCIWLLPACMHVFHQAFVKHCG